MKTKTKNISNQAGRIMSFVMPALMAAVLCISAPFAINIGPIPISLATFVIYISIFVLGVKSAAISTFLYLVLGMIGLPVFSEFQGGIGKLLGPTGGYLIGYIPMVLIGGGLIYLVNRYSLTGKKTVIKYILYFLSLVVATAALYVLGTAWFMISTGNG
ncbi:MAG: biotin transporter BioY, partial [Oribacterium sp.]|nr:biotin transporter BioY [Oribacterium sp.]